MVSFHERVGELVVGRGNSKKIRQPPGYLVAGLRPHHVPILIKLDNQQDDSYQNANIRCQCQPPVQSVRVQNKLLFFVDKAVYHPIVRMVWKRKTITGRGRFLFSIFRPLAGLMKSCPVARRPEIFLNNVSLSGWASPREDY